MSALASEPVQTSLWDEDNPIPHTRLGQGADAVVVCPATARVIGAYAAGISSDLLTATLLATMAPVIVCPAMHTEMWANPAVQENIRNACVGVASSWWTRSRAASPEEMSDTDVWPLPKPSLPQSRRRVAQTTSRACTC